MLLFFSVTRLKLRPDDGVTPLMAPERPLSGVNEGTPPEL
jgi:hypothetical protein